MDRTVSFLLPLVALLIGLVMGQATARPITITAPAAVAAASTDPGSDKLTPYQRADLITKCYNALAGDAVIAYELTVKPCLSEIRKMP